MAGKTIITEDWLADRASLHDAKILCARLDDKTLKVQIDDEWSNIPKSVNDEAQCSGGSLVFEGVDILDGQVEKATDCYVSELSFDGRNWKIYLARRHLLSKRGRLIFRANSASFLSEI